MKVKTPTFRYALLHDFDALNKAELLGFDAWHSLIDKPEAEMTEEDKTFLDQIAMLTMQVNERFHYLQSLYRTTPYGQAVQNRVRQLDHSGVGEAR